MHPSRPSSSDPNAAYRAAIASLADNNILFNEEAEPTQAENAENQQNPLAGLNPRRSNNRKRLNAIAHHLGIGVRTDSYTMDPTPPYLPSESNSLYRASLASIEANLSSAEETEHSEEEISRYQQQFFAELSTRRPIQTDRPSASTDAGTSTGAQVSLDTIVQYLRERGLRSESKMTNATVNYRLRSCNLSTETLFTAIRIADTPDHPLFDNLPATDKQRQLLIAKLSGIINNSQGLRQGLLTSVGSANNNSEQLIKNVLEFLKASGH